MEEAESSSRPPIWFPIVLGIQVFLSLIILGLSAYIIHGYYFNTIGFDIFLCIATWILVAYHYSTLYASSLGKYRIPLAILVADALMVIFWLSAMGATAALRASFKYKVEVEDCYNNGHLINSDTCVVDRSIEKRDAVASNSGLSAMSAIAGLSAIEMLLYIACLVFGILAWNRSSSSESTTRYTPQKQNEGYSMEATHEPYVQEAYVQAPQSTMQQPYFQQSYDERPYASRDYNLQPSTQPYSESLSSVPIH